MTLTADRSSSRRPARRERTNRRRRLARSAASAPFADPYAIGSLRSRVGGPIVLRGDTGWDAASQAWDFSAGAQPAAIALVTSIDDAVEVAEFARAHRLRIAPAGGELWAIALVHGDGAGHAVLPAHDGHERAEPLPSTKGAWR